MSSTPSAHPAVKLTVTVVDARVHPVVTSCIEPVVTSRVQVWPASSESVRVLTSCQHAEPFQNPGTGRKGKNPRCAGRVGEIDLVGRDHIEWTFPRPLSLRTGEPGARYSASLRRGNVFEE